MFLNINLELQQALVHERDICSLDFNTAVARLQDIDNRIQTLSRNMSRFRSRNNSSLLPHNSPAPFSLTTTQGGDAMDLSAISYQPRGFLSTEEKERRRNLGLCYYCGKGKHKASDCKIKNLKNSVKGYGVETVHNSDVIDSEKVEAL